MPRFLDATVETGEVGGREAGGGNQVGDREFRKVAGFPPGTEGANHNVVVATGTQILAAAIGQGGGIGVIEPSLGGGTAERHAGSNRSAFRIAVTGCPRRAQAVLEGLRAEITEREERKKFLSPRLGDVLELGPTRSPDHAEAWMRGEVFNDPRKVGLVQDIIVVNEHEKIAGRLEETAAAGVGEAEAILADQTETGRSVGGEISGGEGG
jgi:hypothetical protein